MTKKLKLKPTEKTRVVVESSDSYHATNGISASGLKAILQSPAHYYTEYELGQRPDPTPALRFGNIVHSAILEPRNFLENYKIQPDFDRRTKVGKADYAAWMADLSPENIVMKAGEADQIVAMIKSIQSHPVALGLLKDGIAERSVYFTDPETKLLCKCRPDFLREDGRIVDLKTTTNASFGFFQSQIAKFEYHLQAAFYKHGIQTAFDSEVREFVWIVIEKKPPYIPAVYIADETILERGRQLWKRAMKTYKRCIDSKTWPGYQFSEDANRYEAQTISLPPWALWDYEEEGI